LPPIPPLCSMRKGKWCCLTLWGADTKRRPWMHEAGQMIMPRSSSNLSRG